MQLHRPIQHHSDLMDAVTELAPAKINLVLRVGPRRTDGYHEVLSLMTRVDLADSLTLARAARTVVECPGLEGGDTLVTRALAAFVAAVGTDRVPGGFHAVVTKRVPAGAGLGGGSSDAAAALRGANRLSGSPLTADELAARRRDHRLGRAVLPRAGSCNCTGTRRAIGTRPDPAPHRRRPRPPRPAARHARRVRGVPARRPDRRRRRCPPRSTPSPPSPRSSPTTSARSPSSSSPAAVRCASRSWPVAPPRRA